MSNYQWHLINKTHRGHLITFGCSYKISGSKEDGDCLDSNVLFDKMPYFKKTPQLKFGFNMSLLK